MQINECTTPPKPTLQDPSTYCLGDHTPYNELAHICSPPPSASHIFASSHTTTINSLHMMLLPHSEEGLNSLEAVSAQEWCFPQRILNLALALLSTTRPPEIIRVSKHTNFAPLTPAHSVVRDVMQPTQLSSIRCRSRRQYREYILIVLFVQKKKFDGRAWRTDRTCAATRRRTGLNHLSQHLTHWLPARDNQASGPGKPFFSL